jgi:4-hydroxyphenylpyruvate dioxygenase-like putative hemolysin
VIQRENHEGARSVLSFRDLVVRNLALYTRSLWPFCVFIVSLARVAGFGAGNFKALFESIEIQQAERGNSVAY